MNITLPIITTQITEKYVTHGASKPRVGGWDGTCSPQYKRFSDVFVDFLKRPSLLISGSGGRPARKELPLPRARFFGVSASEITLPKKKKNSELDLWASLMSSVPFMIRKFTLRLPERELVHIVVTHYYNLWI